MFVTLEGIEGSGKSTLLRGLATAVEARGQRVVCTREPGGSGLGNSLRPLLLAEGKPLVPLAELFLFQADRAQHVAEVIRPALEQGQWVLCDRYADSTIAYQGYGRGFDQDLVRRLSNLATDALTPEVTFLLDVEPAVGLGRARNRNAREAVSANEGRFEAETLAFHTRVRQGFLALAREESHRFVILDATLSEEALLEEALRHLLFPWNG